MQQCYDKEWFREAPAYILVCENHGAAWTRRYDEKNHADIDVAIAIEHLCLAAAEQGLGSCWVCNFRVQLCQELFKLPEEWYPAAIIGLVALVFTAVGMHLGTILGCRTKLGQYAEVLGGGVLMAIGAKILWQAL